ncbi:hypothetical protein LCGC14_2725760, partial [marine sediment metagenome]
MRRYTEEQYGDVARVLSTARERVNYTEGLVLERMPRVRDHLQFVAEDFADLFTADNPETCCGQPIDAVYEFCLQRGEDHRY